MEPAEVVSGTITTRHASRWDEFSDDELRKLEAALLLVHTLNPIGENERAWSDVYDELDRRGQAPAPATATTGSDT